MQDPMDWSSKPQLIALWIVPGTAAYETHDMATKPQDSEIKGDFSTLNSEGHLRLLQPIHAREQFKKGSLCCWKVFERQQNTHLLNL